MEFFTEYGGELITGSVAVLVFVGTQYITSRREQRRWETTIRREAYERFYVALQHLATLHVTWARLRNSGHSDRGYLDEMPAAVTEFDHSYSAALLVCSPTVEPELRRVKQKIDGLFDEIMQDRYRDEDLSEVAQATLTAMLDTLRSDLGAKTVRRERQDAPRWPG